MKFLKGINRDVQPIDQPEHTYRDGKNIILSKKLGAIVNEKGTINHQAVGMDVIFTLPAEEKTILFGKNGNLSEIKVYNTDTNVVTTIISNEELDFEGPLQAVYERDYKGDLLVYWTDNKNPPRFINISSDPPTSIEELNLFPYIDSVPSIENITVNDTGGNLKTGTYIFAIKYIDEDNTPTNYVTISQPVHINLDSSGKGYAVQGSKSNILTPKSISFDIKNISQKYRSLRVTAIPVYDGVIDVVQRLPEFLINNTETPFTYSGTESFKVEALENVQIDNAAYSNAKAITVHDNQLYLGNLKEDEDIGYQKYANKIIVEPAIKLINGYNVIDEDTSNATNNVSYDGSGTYKDINNHNNFRGYKRDEVYAFYISWMLKNGKETRAYHIPGLPEEGNFGTKSSGSIEIETAPRDTSATAPETDNFTVTSTLQSTDFLEVQLYYGGSPYENPYGAPFLLSGGTPEQMAQRFRDVLQFYTNDFVISGSGDSFKFTHNVKGTSKNGVFIGFEISQIENEPFPEMEGESPPDPDILNNNSSTFDNGVDGDVTGYDVFVQFTSDVLTYSRTFFSQNFTYTNSEFASWLTNELNDDSNFSEYYTASVSVDFQNPPKFFVIITAKGPGETYDTSNLAVDVVFSGLNPNFGEYNFIIEQIAGGETYEITEGVTIGGITGKAFQLLGSDVGGQMGYWENQQETYPDNEHWNSSDIGGPNLTNQPVRHHKFPSAIGEPLINSTYSSNQYRVMGFKLTNVEIPEHLKDKVVGYKVYRAQRSNENKTILDQSYIFNGIKEDGILAPNLRFTPIFGSPIQDSIKTNIFYAHPFKNMLDEESLSSLSHIKAVGYFDSTFKIRTIGGGSGTSRLGQLKIDNFETKEIEDNDKIRSILGAARVESVPEDTVVSLIPFGINESINNRRGESKIVLRISSPFNNLSSVVFRNFSNDNNILADLCTKKDNVYNSFDKQVLIQTGYTHYDLDNLDSEDIFGGDTFINVFNYKLMGRRGGDSAGTLISGVVESEYNIALRKSGEKPWEIFYPHSSPDRVLALNWRDGEPRYGSFETSDQFAENYFAYNTDASYNNTIKNIQVFPKRDIVLNKHPWRVTRSEQLDEEALNKFRIFRQDNFTDLPKNRGNLIKLSVFNNTIIPHMRRGLLRTKGREQLQTDGVTAFIGVGDIFAIKPDDYIFTENGFGGIASPDDSINTPFGYLFVDRDGKRVFNLTNEGLNEVSNAGLRNFFYDEIQNRHVSLGYDPQYRRILIKLGTEYCVSYYPEFQAFGSFHGYHPDIFFNGYDRFFAIYNQNIHEHNVGDFGSFYGEAKQYASIIFVDNRSPDISKLVRSVSFNTELMDGEEEVNSTFDRFRATNSYQDTGIKTIVPFVFDADIDYINEIEARRTKRRWFINGFRDESNVPQNTPNNDRWLYQRRLEHKYTVVELRYVENAHQLYLYDAEVNYKLSIR